MQSAIYAMWGGGKVMEAFVEEKLGAQGGLGVADLSGLLVKEVEKAIVGKSDKVQLAVLCLLSGGHLLLEDIPGIGKTTLAKAISQAIGGEFRRLQFTPDLLPSDITGSSIFNQKSSDFEFRPGPVFGNVILADEINRATPKTQSALLEAMEEGQVTTDGETRMLPTPFFVIATQNSVEMTGTYPLPEAQLDRFFARLSLGYPNRMAEAEILLGRANADPLGSVSQVATLESLVSAQNAVKSVFAHETVVGYIVDIVRATRESPLFSLGSSPRGSLHLMRAAQAMAAMDGRNFIKPDDVKAVVPIVLGHRILARADVRARAGANSIEAVSQILSDVVATVPVPTIPQA